MKSIIRKCCSYNLVAATKIKNIRSFSNDIISDNNEKNKVDDVNKNIIVEKFGGITTINIDRHEKRNSLDLATVKEMTAAIRTFECDERAKVLIINGEGGSFCAGFDINEIDLIGYDTLTDAAVDLTRRPICSKPTIAAVSGYAVGSGFSLALACDLRIIEDTAMLGFLNRRFGAPMGMKGYARITSLIGLSRALDLIMTGRLISGTEAFQMGIANKTTSTGTALGEAVKLAKSLTKFPQSGLKVDKLLAIHSQLGQDNNESLRDEALILSLLGDAQQDLKVQIRKFHEGVGRHGKFSNLKEVPLKDWEIEHRMSEIVVSKSKPDGALYSEPMLEGSQPDCSGLEDNKKPKT